MGLLETPLLLGSARRVGGPSACIVRAATAGPAGSRWLSALRCRRRPDHRPCRGHVVLYRSEGSAPILWACSSCESHGTIDGWARSVFDLRAGRLTAGADPGPSLLVADEVADVLRGLVLLDADTERVVFAARATAGGALLAAADRDLQALLGFVAAEASQEHSVRRRRRLDEAFDVLIAGQRPRTGVPAAKRVAAPLP